jgi:hypothetical protein
MKPVLDAFTGMDAGETSKTRWRCITSAFLLTALGFRERQ